MKQIVGIKPLALAPLLAVVTFFSCQSPSQHKEDAYNSLTQEEKLLPENALKGIMVAEGLEATLFASEPVITNPTNIDIDHRGRVWVCEAYNYRPEITGNAPKAEGDRIVILEDTDGDGKSDKSTIFYQGPELNAPLGIWVMGNKAIVSQSPYVWLFTDTDGDDKADKKEIIFQGIEGEQHDHGMHAFVFGPDGKFYFNFGNEGMQIKDAQGNTVKDVTGKEVSTENYKQGLVFRSNLDFSEFEVLGQNFRNNYEVAVDSYGTMWQSDNDDDGNKGVRINYVMEYGNYGYTDEMTGAGWRANRTNKEEEIPQQHWHLNDPGVVPNLLQTGAGSPTGMAIYEGRLLPEVFWDQMIHTDAGPSVVRAYPVTKNGAGYNASIVNIMEGHRDQWFRPSDVCVAPDGSLFVSDWYDPGVGGHQVGDLERGRIYRIAPKDHAYQVPKVDVASYSGAIEALQNPNLSVRYLAWQKLNSMGDAAEEELVKLFKSHENPRIRARALWLLSKIPGKGENHLTTALQDPSADIRIVALRAARQLKINLFPYLSSLVNDADAQVRRECAIALRHLNTPEASSLWATLANQHDGNDRWYLEALGIGADGQWDRYFSAWLDQQHNKELNSNAQKDIVWRARTAKAIPYLASLASNHQESLDQRLRYFRAFDFNANGPEKSKALLDMINGNVSGEHAGDAMRLKKLALTHLDPSTIRRSAIARQTLSEVLAEVDGTMEYVEMVQRHGLKEENPKLLQLAIDQSDLQIGRAAAATLLQQGGDHLVRQALKKSDEATSLAMMTAIRGIGSSLSLQLLEEVAFDDSIPLPLRREATAAIGRSYGGENRILELLRSKKLPDNLIASAVTGVSNAWRQDVRTEAATYLPQQATGNDTSLPPISELLPLTGEIEKGKAVFNKTCSICHQVGDYGTDFGPKLTEIGSKLSKEAQYLSIIHPDAGISFGYEGYRIDLKDGSTMGGIISSRTETDIDLKLPDGSVVPVKTSDVAAITQLENSMMPAGLQHTMTKEDLVNLVEYLMSLKRNS